MMTHILTGLQGFSCLVYLDNIIIFGKSLEDHNEKLKSVLNRLQEYHSKLQPDKCNCLRKEITYLGHIMSAEGVKPDPAKLFGNCATHK